MTDCTDGTTRFKTLQNHTSLGIFIKSTKIIGTIGILHAWGIFLSFGYI